jgi:hypothetical protein
MSDIDDQKKIAKGKYGPSSCPDQSRKEDIGLQKQSVSRPWRKVVDRRREWRDRSGEKIGGEGRKKKKKREKVRGGGYRVGEREWGKKRSVDELVDG